MMKWSWRIAAVLMWINMFLVGAETIARVFGVDVERHPLGYATLLWIAAMFATEKAWGD